MLLEAELELEELTLLLELVVVLEEVLLEVDEPPEVRVCADISGAAIAIAIIPAVRIVAIFFISVVVKMVYCYLLVKIIF